ncbi:hypothetical protein MRX96_003968 [Rhipicephalus microplus]
MCRRYRDLRDENGNWTFFHWKLLAVRLAFVIIFEHVVFCVCRLIDLVVPDIPSQLGVENQAWRRGKDDDDDEETEAPAV